MTLRAPQKDFAQAILKTKTIDPASLVRISRRSTSEPHFGRSGGNRFDDPRKAKKYGTSYFGFNLHCAFAETVLHNESAQKNGGFRLATSELERYVLTFEGAKLNVAILHGIELKNLGGDGSLSTVTPYTVPQQWSLAVHNHPQHVDGFVYVSRHLNTAEALVVFERAKDKLTLRDATALRDYPGAAGVLIDFRIHPL
ncbi:RES family NAD+ phosphorylase [Paraburkholderia sp. A3RO-2L]|uniref:RES family NAD+ phosphorylase n=1 Tax=unclassified Paraburkholderia TaxID=2615204 RepID=UPI003DA897F9